MDPKLRIGVCQFPVARDTAANARQILRFMNRAHRAGAHLVQFPESALPGYRTAADPPLDARWWSALDGYTREIADRAGRRGLWVVLGSSQSNRAGAPPLNSLVLISPDGEVVGRYHKRRLAPAEAGAYTAGRRSYSAVIQGVHCGFLICHEACHPDLFAAYRKQGVRLLFHSCHNVSRSRKLILEELALAQLRTRAADFGMWIASSNSSARQAFSSACVARPDGSICRLKRHIPGLLIHDFPDPDVGWTYAAG